MEKIRNLNIYQKGVFFLMIIMVLVFTVIYPITISRVGFEYKNTILVPSQEDGSTVYSGEIQGIPAQFKVSEDKTVVFQFGDKMYGPYTAKEDLTAVPKDNEMQGHMIGVELRRGDEIVFRGGVMDIGGTYWLCNEDGSLENMGISFGVGNGMLTDEHGNVIDPMEPSTEVIFDLMSNPGLTHKGEWLAWFGAVVICVLNTFSMLFADEVFRWNLAFRIRHVEDAEPSEWEIAGRYIGWTVLTIMALVIFVVGLQ